MYLESLSSLVQWVRQEPSWVKRLSGAPPRARLQALPTNIRLGRKSLRWTNIPAYFGQKSFITLAPQVTTLKTYFLLRSLTLPQSNPAFVSARFLQASLVNTHKWGTVRHIVCEKALCNVSNDEKCFKNLTTGASDKKKILRHWGLDLISLRVFPLVL